MAARTSRTRPAGTNPCLALRRRLTYLPTASVLYLHSPPMPRLLERMTITAWSPRVSNATVISLRSTRSNNSYSSSSSSSRRTSIPTPNRPSPSHPYNPCGTLPSPPVPGSFRALPFLSTDLPRTIVPLRVQNSVGKGVGKKMVSLPEGNLWKDHAPAKVDECKVIAFFTSDIVRKYKQPVMQAGHKEDYLTKRGWKTRFFVLQGPVLEYYDCRGGAHLGSITVTGAQIGRGSERAVTDEEKECRHTFLIVEAKRGPGRNHPRHVLCAENDADRDSWVEMLVRYFSDSYNEEFVSYGQLAFSNSGNNGQVNGAGRPSTDAPNGARAASPARSRQQRQQRTQGSGACASPTLLVLSAGRDDTAEGLTCKLVLRYYVRGVRRQPPSCAIGSIYKDLDLGREYSGRAAMDVSATYTELTVEVRTRLPPTPPIAFTHRAARITAPHPGGVYLKAKKRESAECTHLPLPELSRLAAENTRPTGVAPHPPSSATRCSTLTCRRSASLGVQPGETPPPEWVAIPPEELRAAAEQQGSGAGRRANGSWPWVQRYSEL
ncbi:hypothetical protein B0H11DRAFT_2258311 [Mycena galericulata]|nr:hypothetical protein B0H11DRAFT_2258311 [Mycena galericulata]